MAGMGGYGQGTRNLWGQSSQRRTQPSPSGQGNQTSSGMTPRGNYARRGGGSGGLTRFDPQAGAQPQRSGLYVRRGGGSAGLVRFDHDVGRQQQQQRSPNVNQGMNSPMLTPTPPQSSPTPPQSSPMGGLIGVMPLPPRVDGIAPVGNARATREAYARAKDTAGQQGRAALDALMDLQGARGIVGSGIGVNEAGGVIAEGARQLGDFNREQTIQQVENERRRQEMNFQGRISQRGQDLSWQEMELQRRRWNAQNSPYGHLQGAEVNPIPGYPRY